jgi:hypothetical protein
MVGYACSCNDCPVIMDVQVAYQFHHLRETKPGLAPNRIANQMWYSTFSCTSGKHKPAMLPIALHILQGFT